MPNYKISGSVSEDCTISILSENQLIGTKAVSAGEYNVVFQSILDSAFTYNDNFNDSTTLNTDKWKQVKNSVNTQTIEGSRLKFVNTAGYGSNQIEYKCTVVGDFDFLVYYDVSANSSSLDAYGTGLQAYLSTGDIYQVTNMTVGSRKFNFNQYMSGTWSDIGNISTTNTNGRLRLIRKGAITRAYYYISAWVLIGTSTDYGSAPNVTLKCVNNSWDTFPTVTSYIDNFTILSAQHIIFDPPVLSSTAKFTVMAETSEGKTVSYGLIEASETTDSVNTD